MPWEIEGTDEFAEWFGDLTLEQQISVDRIVRMLELDGPALDRPHVGVIRSSRYYPRMKELICNGAGSLRILFIFDPRRHAVLLLGGDKTGKWREWYRVNVPRADDLYAGYLEELRRDGAL
jgi:hypothetical protein